jgi:hypothetical protein
MKVKERRRLDDKYMQVHSKVVRFPSTVPFKSERAYVREKA